MATLELSKELDGSSRCGRGVHKVFEIAAEQTTQTPVVDLQPKNNDSDDSDEDGGSGPARCSQYVCRLKCQIYGCIRSQCLDDNRCSCLCPRYTDPFDQFFKSILTSHLEPGISVRRRPISVFPSFGISAFGDNGETGLFDIRKLFDEVAGSGKVHAKVFRTMQQTCRQPEDCSSACSNCTQTQCNDRLCRCNQCSLENVDSRSTNVAETCQSARDCLDYCKNCIIVMCRYGSCQCGSCTAESDTPVTPETESAESTTAVPVETTTASAGADDGTTPVASETATEILTVRTNETLSAAENAHSRKCVPKQCNHSCWERQCSKWNCVEERCECDGCPEEVAVVVKNVEGKPEKLQEDNTKYEIIF
ncbi:hypothetical protein BIW11_09893 [Tropilaelaps mercedesae]|uniref:Uncharacterized protein n=1 Tax=Tropilaelaps mercedesae TaxID=418985 RepID=A0A1V9XIK8_9ACAR|nr:hypothetical protein BIW11_09893 [Tropilaelaps mercedesae]